MTDVESWPVGAGMVVFDWVYLISAWATFIYTAWIERVGRDRRRTLRFARRLLLVGVGVLAFNAAWRMWLLGDLPISAPALAGQTLIFAAVVLFARDTLGITGARLWPPTRPPLA